MSVWRRVSMTQQSNLKASLEVTRLPTEHFSNRFDRPPT
jgi:hypothetical protein